MLEQDGWKIKGENESFLLSFDGKSNIEISGKMAAMPDEYDQIEDFFGDILNTVVGAGTPHLVLDIRNLFFLNSSGIKSLCVSFVMEADENEDLQLTILARSSITWQVETLPTFKDLMEQLTIQFEE